MPMSIEHALTADTTPGPGASSQPPSEEAAEALISSSGISRRLWRLYAYAWFVCLLFPLLALAQGQRSAVQATSAAAGIALFVGCYIWVMWPHPLRFAAAPRVTGQAALALCGGLTLLVLALSAGNGTAFLWLFVGVSAIVGVVLPARDAFVGVMALTLITLGASIAISGGLAQTDWLHVLPLVLLVRGLGLDMAGVTRLGRALSDLQDARRELAQRAVANERSRLARDLHDLLGHALSLIALKSELARRVLADAPARAADELLAVERVARQTLREVREAVAGYRQPTLAGELDGARQLLDAAGIAATIAPCGEELSPTVDGVLAWAVREGVTNVIHHSRARWCRIHIGREGERIVAEVSNDGVAGEEAGGHAARSKVGGGLTGLRERVAALGGTVEARLYHGDEGAAFRLRVWLPAERPDAGARQR
jgi:two-component system sensor histidine kinase DesK